MNIRNTMISLVTVATLFTACGGGGGSDDSSGGGGGGGGSTDVPTFTSFDSYGVVAGTKRAIQLNVGEPNMVDGAFVFEYKLVSQLAGVTIDKDTGVIVYRAPNDVAETTIQVTAERVNTNGEATGVVSAPFSITFTPETPSVGAGDKPYKVSDAEVSDNKLREFTRTVSEGLDIVENQTGLVWEDNEAQPNNLHFYSDANDYCTGLGTDWRIPTKNELLNLVDYSKAPYVVTTNEHSMIPDDIFTKDMINVWAERKNGRDIFFNENNGMYFYKADDQKLPVRCVKGDKASNQHLVHTDLFGYTYDETTKFEWTKPLPSGTVCSAFSSDHLDNNNQAAPHTGYRLPSINELRSIMEGGTVSSLITGGQQNLISSTPYIDANGTESATWVLYLNQNGYTDKASISAGQAAGNVVCVKDMP